MGSFVDRTIIFMQHDRRKFVRQLDYLTSPGWLDGPAAREKAGLARGGPAAVITDMGILRFDRASRQMVLACCHPGVTPQQVLDKMEFNVAVQDATQTPAPTAGELEILRDKCDPQRLILGK